MASKAQGRRGSHWEADTLELIGEGLDHLEQGFTVFDSNLELVVWNRAVQKLVDFPAEWFKRGANLADAYRYNAERGEYGPGDVEEQIRERVERAMKFEPHRMVRERPDGTILEIAGTPLPTGGLVTTYTDITRQKKHEEALQKSRDELDQRVAERTSELEEARDLVAREQALLQVTLENMSQGISMFDKDLNALVFNRRFGELLDIPEEMMKPGTPMSEFLRFNAERGEYGPGDVEAQVRERLDLAAKFEPHRFRRERPDGTIIEVVGIPLAEGGFVTTYEDVTAQVRGEEAIRRNEESLENLVRQRTEELRQKNIELERSNSELESFAYVASHDLREPLRNVTSFTTLLARKLSGRLSAEESEYLEFVRDGALRMDLLVRDLLDFSRVGRMDTPMARVSIADVVGSVLGQMQAQLTESGAEVESAPDFPFVAGRRSELERVFTNLVGNALKYRNPGCPPRVTIGWAEDGAMRRFHVRDNGIGIPDGHGHEERIFMLFQRLHQRNEYGGGTGVGLAVTKKIVERHGGHIWVESAPGEGSTFYFTLPAAE